MDSFSLRRNLPEFRSLLLLSIALACSIFRETLERLNLPAVHYFAQVIVFSVLLNIFGASVPPYNQILLLRAGVSSTLT